MSGGVLKERREALGLDIREVSRMLKIRADYLSAIENDDFERLPVQVYTSGYIRCYASYLKVDAAPIVEFYKGRLSQPQAATLIPIAYSHKKVPKAYYFSAVLFVAASAFAVYSFREQGKPRAENTASRMNSDIRLAQTVQVVPSEPPVQSPAPAPLSTPSVDPAAPSGVSPSSSSVLSSEHRLAVTASEMTWLRISFSDGKTEEATLKPGETCSWRYSEIASLKVGNSGGVRLNLDGRDLGFPGESGQVRTLSLP